ncbi:acyltransferase [Herminiimonas sp. KBW02]|uniref:LpxL/LpxP family acyltransferase n=1 Tax=Herminiimonas sp. KBW02 TaxID=2153363 RepID=UPI0018F52583|nr:acyltransferase [Herminiimonas sp. KBW02]
MSTQARHWASINEASFVAGMRLLFWIYRWFGRWPFRIVLYPVLLWYVMSKPIARRASRNYLQHVAQFIPINTGMWGVLRHFASFAESILDKMLLWGGLFKTDQVKFHGVADINRLISEKRGALMICSHLGNLELCRVLSRQHGQMRLTILVHTKHARAFNQMLAALNPGSQLNLLQVTEMTPATAMLLAEKIADGEFVVIAGDRVPVSAQPRTAIADFLGEAAAFPVGPYVLASILQCPTYLLFSIQRCNHPEVHFELLRESIRLPRKERDAVLRTLVTDYAARLQHHTLNAPLQWFNFYDFWHLPKLEAKDASC